MKLKSKDIVNKLKSIEPIKLFTILLMGVMPIIIVPWLADRFYEPKIIFTYVVVAITLLFVYDRQKWANSSIIEFLVLGFILWLALSTIFSVDLSMSLLGRVKRREGFLAIVFYCLIFLIMYKEFKFSKKVFNIVNIFITLIAFYGIVQYMGFDPIPGDELRKYWHKVAFSTIGNRDFLSSLMTLYLPLNICFYLRSNEKKYLGISAILFGDLLATITRSGWVAFIVYSFIILLYCIKHRGYFRRYITLIAAFTVIFGIFNLNSNGRLSARFNTISSDVKEISTENNDMAGSSRMYIWKRGVTFIPQYPILGSGPDTFGVVFMGKYSNEYDYMRKIVGGIVDKAHNEYLQLAVTSGVPSLILYLSLIGIIVFRLFKKIVITKNNCGVLYLGLLMSVVGYLIQAFFNISVVGVAPIFWAMLGIAAKLGERDVNKVENII